MSHSRGAVSFEPLFTAEDIGLRKEANVEHVMKVFVTLGEGRASRWIEMPKARFVAANCARRSLRPAAFICTTGAASPSTLWSSTWAVTIV